MKPAPGTQLALFASYSYHAMITGREGNTLELEADHRRHAEIENAIRDLKYGVGLNHLPSGALPCQRSLAGGTGHGPQPGRWTGRIAPGETVATTKTLRRRFLSLAGRITRKARQLTLHLPRRWPWGNPVCLCSGTAAGHSTARLTTGWVSGRSSLIGVCKGFSGGRVAGDFQLVFGPGFGQQPDPVPEPALGCALRISSGVGEGIYKPVVTGRLGVPAYRS